MNKNTIISIGIFATIIFATILVILFGKGYRFGFDEGKVRIKGTGLLVVKSIPDAASVYIDDKLATATNNTLDLAPGKYKVKISKEGYFAWEKTIIIQAETVARAEALLIPTAPKLESITDSGVENPIIDPTLTKIAFEVSSQSAKKNGIYVYDMTNHPLLSIQSSATQIADDTTDLFSSASLVWSPDGKDIKAEITGDLASNLYLLNTDQLNVTPNNINLTTTSVDTSWNKIKLTKDKSVTDALPTKLQPVVKKYFNVLAYSPDENKIIYQASRSATLPIVIKPRIIGTNSTAENRNIEKDKIYVYDIQEDKNYDMDQENFKGTFSWFTDNRHIIFVRNKELHMMEFDGVNDTVVYAGPFIDSIAFPWPDATKIVILTNLGNSKILPNLYTISLK